MVWGISLLRRPKHIFSPEAHKAALWCARHGLQAAADPPGRVEALEEIKAHPEEFERLATIYRLSRALIRIRNWTIGIFATIGFFVTQDIVKQSGGEVGLWTFTSLSLGFVLVAIVAMVTVERAEREEGLSDEAERDKEREAYQRSRRAKHKARLERDPSYTAELAKALGGSKQ